jgi:hypothetical protein
MVMAAKRAAFTCGLLDWFIYGLTGKRVIIKVQQFLVLGNFSAKLDIPYQIVILIRVEVAMQMGRSFQKLMAGNLLHTEVVGLECEPFTRDSRTINSRR